jgi:ribosomal protein S18 acetylase RimI-like enzyme
VTHESLESNQLYLEAWSQFARASRDGEVAEEQGIVIATAGVAWPGMNLAFLGSPVSASAELAERVAVARRFFAERNRLWLFVLFDDWLSPRVNARAVFANQNLRFIQESIGMKADRLSVVGRQLPDLSFCAADDARILNDFASVNAASYGIPVSWAQEAVESGQHWDPPANTYVGYLDREAVVTSMTRPIGEVRYVGWVATKPAKRRQGCAEAMVRYALRHSGREDGTLRSMLHATPAGVRLYEQLGFRRVARFELYLGGSLPKS